MNEYFFRHSFFTQDLIRRESREIHLIHTVKFE